MGQFDWFLKIGATPQAVAVLNDQPILFTILIVVLIAVILECVLMWYIHYATMKPEQRAAKNKKKKAGTGDNKNAAPGGGSCGLSKEYADGKRAAEVKSDIDGRWGKERGAIDGRRAYSWGIATAISTDGQTHALFQRERRYAGRI
ncbi:uncharacterized protein B0T23DRAFT_396821 [Neurospora hispaniola]|uniref:Uncharacterized protein n=1 Tax=Neurospora hispaniola TaxID=588809 RepID=A0AAJ0MQB7_9PEZI|nr:hypothetical protein B0T23DRAFT_396821 [Neurospora hispaniola]